MLPRHLIGCGRATPGRTPPPTTSTCSKPPSTSRGSAAGRAGGLRADAAGCTHDFLAYLRQAGVGFSVGYAITEAVKTTIRGLDADAWTPALTQDGEVREGAAVAELTDQLDLRSWPAGARVLVRREPLHPGAQQTLEDIDGCRFTAFLTDQPDADIAVLEQRHRARARVEDRIRGAKDTGARNLPCDTFTRNAVWLQLSWPPGT